MMPGPRATIALPNIPVRSRNAKNDDHVGAKAQDIVNMVNIGNVRMTIGRRPYSSLSGAHAIGPMIR